MKYLMLIGLCVLCTYGHSQNPWTSEQIQVLDNFGLSQTDNRGIILVKEGNQSNYVVPTTLDAIKLYFVPDIRVDIITICITDFNLEEKYYNTPLGMKEIVELYLSIKQ